MLLGCYAAIAQSTYPGSFSTNWYVGPRAVPDSSTAVISQTTYLISMVLANTTASAVSVTVVDQSTNCNSGACQIFPAVSIAANTVYVIDLKGIPAVGGVKWSASSANAIHGSIQGKY
jgi:hypothetical protein